MNSPRFQDDVELTNYLAEVELSQLDLGTIDLHEQERAEIGWQLFRIGCAASLIGSGLWLTTTNWYALHSEASYLLMAAFLAGGWLCVWPFMSLWRHRGRLFPEDLEVPGSLRAGGLPALPQLPSWSRTASFSRFLLFALALSGALALVFLLPAQAEWAGRTYSQNWFIAVLVAVGTGITSGRFLIAQAEATTNQESASKLPWAWPAWMKWLNLACLIGGGLLASYGDYFFGEAGFLRAGIGLVTGIAGAIWISRRFDEWELEIQRDATEKARAQALRASELGGTFD